MISLRNSMRNAFVHGLRHGGHGRGSGIGVLILALLIGIGCACWYASCAFVRELATWTGSRPYALGLVACFWICFIRYLLIRHT